MAAIRLAITFGLLYAASLAAGEGWGLRRVQPQLHVQLHAAFSGTGSEMPQLRCTEGNADAPRALNRTPYQLWLLYAPASSCKRVFARVPRAAALTRTRRVRAAAPSDG
jgi:hypothetical protein